ncbi:DNA polymerase-1 [Rhodoligotrophos appendicifer]|uniref:DNA polymerase I n=1 Tax=Rhodoligotrophos appendicifer TaxID=987056 RepID=UPI00118145F2|nr:DNA polymerase I [Rhodoligotrophos appendicifer]
MNTAPSLTTLSPTDRIFLIDGSGYIFRAYHALPPLNRKSDGLPTGAVLGFCNMLARFLKDTKNGDQPTHLAVVFDYSARSFRNDIYKDYKAHRPDLPEDLTPQFPLIRQAVRAFNVHCVEMEGYEADDIIATYAYQAAEAGAFVRIVSSDKDLMQLVGPHVEMFDPMPGKEKVIGEAEVLEKFGVPPSKVIEVQALAGDSVDNVPGVPGIGIKTGAQLINEYGDLETLLSRAGEIKQQKRREKLIEFAEQARISRRLVTLMHDVPVEVKLATLTVQEPDPQELIGFLKAMEFTTLTRRMASTYDVVAEEVGAAPVKVESWSGPSAPEAAAAVSSSSDRMASPAEGVATTTAAIRAIPFNEEEYKTVQSEEDLSLWMSAIYDAGYVSLSLMTTSADTMHSDLAGISMATRPGQACYIPFGHRASAGLDFGGQDIRQLSQRQVFSTLKPMFEDPSILKIGHDPKADLVVLHRHGIHMGPLEDTMLISYALDSGKTAHSIDDLAKRHLEHDAIALKAVVGTGRTQVAFDLVPLTAATPYAAERADITLRLWLMLKPRLAAERVATVYETLEKPLIPVLAEMERAGIMVDRQVLSRLSGDFAQSMAALEAEIFEAAGGAFNVGSPQQLGVLLFEKMGLPGGKKTKTGAWSTGADILETLAAEGHTLPARVLEWRQLSKLKSTYTDSLPGHIDAQGRVHTSFALASTSTGRLSSLEPNLQNIPVRTEAGRKIRTAFVASPGNKLISADYSQIELRILAHMADIPQLTRAFAEGLDIHAMTASEMFNVPVEGMDPQVRRRAKAINFGIIYGISAFGLANQLSIGREEASDYIKRYFLRFPGIRDYMEATKEYCRRTGFVETIFGRRCHFPGINMKHPTERAFSERAAINAPIQGSAADIIRRAMIRIPDALNKAELPTRMLLQVHDELIFEAPTENVEETIALVVGIMEKAAEPAAHLKVPLQVDARAADNWEAAH